MRELRYSLIGLVIVVVVSFVAIDWNYFYGLVPFHHQVSLAAQQIQSTTAAPSASNTLLIPSLGISAPVNYPDDTSDSAIETSLQTGVAHYPSTALPGQSGSVYIFGHSSDFIWSPGTFKHVFTKLPEIAIGATISLSDSTGKTFTYRVAAKKVVAADDISVLEQDQQLHQLILQTSYPLGTALERYVVFAQLQQ
jgi:LPXTG-site transpeptidase (sortase) family protein